MIKPKQLYIGDKVAIVSLSSGILGEPTVRFQLNLGIQRMNELGLEPVFMPNTLKGLDYIKQHPDKRADDLMLAFKDSSIKGIICAIGGDDTYKTIPYLMNAKFRELVIKHPKIFVGFSDSTNNHLMFNKLGLVTYYGLNFLSDLCELQTDMIPYTKKSYQRLFINEDSYEIMSSTEWYLNRTNYNEDQLGNPLVEKKEIIGYDFIYGSGMIEGVFWGGCLESIYDLYTSERYPDQRSIYDQYHLIPNNDFFKDKIIFLETSEEKPMPNKFKMMLDYLIKEEMFYDAKCLLVGKPYDEIYYIEYRDILVQISRQYNLPIVYNLNFGHALPRTIMPYGLKGEVDFNKKRIRVIEKLFK
jgi:muramoyltetrapeptide carboxypeptidase LdcA involved in peptidoglycan recycling